MATVEGGLGHEFVVPAYGESPFLTGCLASLRSQSHPSPILVTTSTPCSFIARAAEDHGARLVVNPRREGIAADWNFALTAAYSRFVTLAHQDDIYFPEFVADTLHLLERSGATTAFTGYEEIDDEGGVTTSKISRVKHLIERVALGRATMPSRFRMRVFLSFGNPLPCSAVTYDRRQLSDFRFSDDFASNLDWEAWLRLLEEGKPFVRTPRRLIGRRHNPMTATSALIRDGRRAREDAIIFRRLWPMPLSAALAFVYRAAY